ncbi:UDP-glucose 4-epimerase GalE [Novacetimonas hansenii]|uniref:UDP-glucose 4-epimerase GalE n=1 Tax=Novacetimonas hansenii TaxID=436 RepID=UPI000789AB5B|nr:UDP-glucose 4-epimerase GalE [Novacetimonas hansenii]RFP06003.1 UDP-glucose 4-epimerase GalE [Novacetimonas hansenii]WEQ58177.1 UDP-glucose 4-epimerase GalE [Novacetimonas hansenii]CUW48690.1 UDP-glucose 4-epimerase [Novacetimonas hansenii]
MRYFVTGGAGFVGSHVCLEFLEAGHEIVILDDLSTGHRSAVPKGARFIEGSVLDSELINKVLSDGQWDGVLHFAALSLVGDSMRNPIEYMRNNGLGGFVIIDACVRHEIPRFILSSTASLFSNMDDSLIDENCAIDPASPYGESKFVVERALHWADRAHSLKSACLRYFNAAGADPLGRLGEDHNPETHLLPLIIDAGLKRRPPLVLFGNDYPTPDGTCIRDYIHVTDLASAHLDVMTSLNEKSVSYNIGTGQGHSNLELIHTVEKVTGISVPWSVGERRQGDPAILIANPEKIKKEVRWSPKYSDIETLIKHAYQWRVANPGGYRK